MVGDCPSRPMASGSSRYQGYPGYPPAMDSNVAKEPQGRDGGKARGGLPKHMQGQHGPSSKSDPKLPGPSPGEMYHISPVRLERPDNPPVRDDNREKTQNKPRPVQDPDDVSFGKTTMSADKFINALIKQQISYEKGIPEMGSLVPSSTSDGKMLWIPGVLLITQTFPSCQSVANCKLW